MNAFLDDVFLSMPPLKLYMGFFSLLLLHGYSYLCIARRLQRGKGMDGWMEWWIFIFLGIMSGIDGCALEELVGGMEGALCGV